jgi:hypothetical protein
MHAGQRMQPALKRKLLAHLREYWIDYALPLSLFALMVYGIVTLATYEP